MRMRLRRICRRGCHCEEAKPTWQSVLLAVGSCRYCLHGVRIATAPLGPRNDRCGRWSAPGLRLPLSLRGAKRRGNLKAATDGKFRMNDTSRRLPRPFQGLAMTWLVVPSHVIARRRSRRGNLFAPINGKFLPNGTSRRLPRPRWGLAMTDVEGQIAAAFSGPRNDRR